MKKIISLVLMVVISLSLFACNSQATNETQSANATTTQTQVNTQPASAQPQANGQTVAGSNKYAKTYDGQVTGRTRIENGQILEWAENYPEDKTIKPTKYEVVEGLSVPGHRLYYNVDGQEIKVAVNESDGSRRYYEAGKTRTFAQVTGDGKSNEQVLQSYNANMKLNEIIDSKYR